MMNFLNQPGAAQMLFGIGSGLLQGNQPGGTLAGGMQQAFRNGLLAAESTRRNAYVQAQTERLKQQQEAAKRLQDSQRRIAELWGQPQTEFKADLFPGEQPIPGLLNKGSGYQGGEMSLPELQQGLLSEYSQTNPAAFTTMLGQMSQGQEPTSAMQNYEFLVGQGVDPSLAREQAFGKMTINNVVGSNKPLSPSDLQKLRDPEGNELPYGTTERDAAQMGARVIKPRTPEQAGKEQMLKVAQNQLPLISGYLFNEDGSINRKNVFNSRLGIPGTDGQTLGVAIEAGVQAVTRSETGAAMQSQEIDNTRKRFQPSPVDTDAAIRLKWQMYQDFLNGSLDLIDTGGSKDPAKWRFDDKAFDAELKRREMAENLGQPTTTPDYSAIKILSVE